MTFDGGSHRSTAVSVELTVQLAAASSRNSWLLPAGCVYSHGTHDELYSSCDTIRILTLYYMYRSISTPLKFLSNPIQNRRLQVDSSRPFSWG